MKKPVIGIILLILLAIILGSLNFRRSHDSEEESSRGEVVKDTPWTDCVWEGDSTEEENVRGLNEIRFENFTEEDWLDNEYIRCLRKYLNDYNSGKIKDRNLDPYKDKVRGSFVIGSCEPSLLGGLDLKIMFVNNPDDVFYAWVYSSVDIETESVLDYSVHEIGIEEEKSGITKEDVLRFLKENPEHKAW